ncbi:uncharacterized protein LOC134264988 [Saccostrea cucullata]|uniref:uncharacterized protein LOC134264988 n=1 Tax=Saccostrea cuccullata TaxID=36930 RepID=UPI002ED04E1A
MQHIYHEGRRNTLVFLVYLTFLASIAEASITLTVHPSSDVEVNQLVTIQCSFSQAEIVALFHSTLNPSVAFCTLEQSGGVCKQGDCARQYTTACPNSKTYSVQYPVPLSWNGESVYCRGLFRDERSNNETFNIIGK